MKSAILNSPRIFKIRVTHSLGFFTVYDDIKAYSYHAAEKIAMERFCKEFCGGKNETTFRGVTTKHTLTAFTFNKYHE